MREARSQDTNAMKFSIISYLPLDPDKDVITPPITGNQKSKRGWNHIWTARFLAPLKDRDIFEENPHAYMKRVQEGKIKLRAKNLPSFLYEEGTVYCATREDKGLFRGHVVIRALRLIFTGESSAFTGHQVLAYACCQIYVNLSVLEHWSNMDSYFDIEKFFKLIIRLFKEPRSRWAANTLDFLTNQLPSLKRKVKRKRAAPIDDSEADESDGNPTGILAQQAARLDEDSDSESTSARSKSQDQTCRTTNAARIKPSAAPNTSGYPGTYQSLADCSSTAPAISKHAKTPHTLEYSTTMSTAVA
ncbi:hypothetical protein BJ912DRAFT_1065122 [Pholiota molesta]|nr:hypothetical protein BJ912DRAFT_1065122 [Pholiota molesta]